MGNVLHVPKAKEEFPLQHEGPNSAKHTLTIVTAQLKYHVLKNKN